MRAPHALPMLLMMPLTAAFQPIMACTSQMQTTRLARYVTVSARSSPPCARDAVVFLCPPVGWQHLNMGRALFEENAVFADAMRECDRIAEAEGMLPRRLLEVLYPAPHEEDECAALLQTPLFTIPALFAVEYSLSAMFEGCAPYAVIGHSVGEYVAAVVAGVFDLPVAMALVCERGRTMEASPLGGSMISLMADAATVDAAIAAQGLGERVSIAAFNGPRSVVIGGTDGDLAAVLDALPDGTKSTRVRATHPDHTALMEPVAVAVGRKCEELLACRPPSTARCFWATSVAEWPMGRTAALGLPEYWRQGIVGAVDFPRAVAAVVRDYADATAVPGDAEAANGDAEAGTAEEWARLVASRQQTTLRFVELGEGMLVRFCQNLRCISDAEAELGRELEFEMAFSHLLPRRASEDPAVDAREIATAVEEVMAAVAVDSVQLAQPSRDPDAATQGAKRCAGEGTGEAQERDRELPPEQEREFGCRRGLRGAWSRARRL